MPRLPQNPYAVLARRLGADLDTAANATLSFVTEGTAGVFRRMNAVVSNIIVSNRAGWRTHFNSLYSRSEIFPTGAFGLESYDMMHDKRLSPTEPTLDQRIRRAAP